MNDLLDHAPNYEWDIARCDLRQWPDDGHSAKVGKRRCVWIMNWPPLYVTVVPHVWCCRWCGTLVSGWWFWRYPLLLHCNPSFPFKKQVIKRKIDREIWDQSREKPLIWITYGDFGSPCGETEKPTTTKARQQSGRVGRKLSRIRKRSSFP